MARRRCLGGAPLSGEMPVQPGVTQYWRASYCPLAARGLKLNPALVFMLGYDRV